MSGGYQIAFNSDVTVESSGDGAPSPMMGIIAQAVAKMIAKKKAREQDREVQERLDEAAAGVQALACMSTAPHHTIDEDGNPETWYFAPTDGSDGDSEHGDMDMGTNEASSSNQPSTAVPEVNPSCEQSQPKKKKNKRKAKKNKGYKK